LTTHRLAINLKPNILIPVPEREMNFGATFAIGRVLSVAAAGAAQAHPSVRWDGFPGRRSHTSKTRWALGFIPTVRIGAGAWRKWAHTRESGDTDQAKTNIHATQKGTQERKEKREEAFKERTPSRSHGEKSAHVGIESSPLARATPLHSVALPPSQGYGVTSGVATTDERENLAD
jgi:hypothetical protein